MKKLALLGTVFGLGAAAIFVSHSSHAADHLDGPNVAMAGNQMADIGDVFSWMTSDGTKVNLAMTVSPADMGVNTFGPSVQYVFHATSHPGASNVDAFGKPGTETKVICTFASNTSAQCWVTQGTNVKGYVTGDPSTAMTSTDGKIKVFAGRRSDPFFFNLAGLKKAIGAVEAAGAGSANPAGCPQLDDLTAGQLRALLQTTSPTAVFPCAANQADCFLHFNVMAIVVQLDKSLVLQPAHHLLSVWGSTHAPQQ